MAISLLVVLKLLPEPAAPSTVVPLRTEKKPEVIVPVPVSEIVPGP